MLSEQEWLELANELGGPTIAGGKMKSVTGGWYSPNTGATNSSGFTALPNGCYSANNGVFENLTYYSMNWASNDTTFTANPVARNFITYFSNKVLSRQWSNVDSKVACRCIKD